MSAATFESLFNPSVLKSLAHFEWTLRAAAKGTFLGNRPSKRLGSGQEFSQYRPYTQGDDIRRLDWKMYGRSERFYIKESEVETDVSIWFLLDDSLSMTYEEDGLSKFDYSRIFIGYLAYLSFLVGDSFGLVTSSGVLPAGHGQRQWQRFVHMLYESQPVEHPQKPTPRLMGKEVIVAFSDLYDRDDEWTNLLSSLKIKQNEVFVFHVLGSTEKALTFSGAVTFQDLEEGTRMQLTPALASGDYRKRLKQWTEGLSSKFADQGVNYQEVTMMQNPTPLIHQFLYESSRLR